MSEPRATQQPGSKPPMTTQPSAAETLVTKVGTEYAKGAAKEAGKQTIEYEKENGQEQIDDARQQLDDAKQNAQQKLDDAKAQAQVRIDIQRHVSGLMGLCSRACGRNTVAVLARLDPLPTHSFLTPCCSYIYYHSSGAKMKCSRIFIGGYSYCISPRGSHVLVIDVITREGFNMNAAAIGYGTHTNRIPKR
ncbi:hypothetical protein BD779DRAFT_1131877 [Infundibulicybe gibba]|nr:hypothetical protein BD779DRAFT_1131877 [Infundibulicybe gibba]